MSQNENNSTDPMAGFLHDHCYVLGQESPDLCEKKTAFVESNVNLLFANNAGNRQLGDDVPVLQTFPLYDSPVGNSDPMLADGPFCENRSKQQYSVLQCPDVSSTTTGMAEAGRLQNMLPCWTYDSVNEERFNSLNNGSTNHSLSAGTDVGEKHLRISSNRFESFPFYCPSNNKVTPISENISYKPAESAAKMAPFRFYKRNCIDTKTNVHRQTSSHWKAKQSNRGHGIVNLTSPDVMNKMRLMYDAQSLRKQSARYAVPVNVPTNNVRAAAHKPVVTVVNSLPECSRHAQQSYLCPQSKIIVSKLLDFNKKYAKSLGNDAKFSLWEQPVKLTAMMTGLELATVNDCQLPGADVDESLIKCTEKNRSWHATKKSEEHENVKNIYTGETKVFVTGRPEPNRLIINRGQPGTMKRKCSVIADNDYASNTKTAQCANNTSSTKNKSHVIPNILRRNYNNSKYHVRSVVESLVDSVCKESDSMGRLDKENFNKSTKSSVDASTVYLPSYKRKIDLDQECEKPTSSSPMVLRKRTNPQSWKHLSDDYVEM